MTLTTGIRVPDAPPIDGLVFRRIRDGDGRAADYAAMAEVMTEACIADAIPWAPSGDNLAAFMEHDPTSDVRSDVILAEVDGELVAWAQASRAMRDGEWVHDLAGWVAPPWRRRGLGRTLLSANIARAREVARESPSEPAVLSVSAEDTETGARAMLAQSGFRPVRWFQLMRRRLDQPIPELPIPDGLEVRPVRRQELRTIHEAENEAFRDHWGHREETDDDLQQRLAQPELDTSLWQVAWAGDEVAGVVQNWIWRAENERLGVQRGWLERVSVRRPWRRRGLARALIARSLELLRDRGMDDAMLGVDSDNPQGALGLYESLGFVLDTRSESYRRSFDP
jgi:mycothiol synthase